MTTAIHIVIFKIHVYCLIKNTVYTVNIMPDTWNKMVKSYYLSCFLRVVNVNVNDCVRWPYDIASLSLSNLWHEKSPRIFLASLASIIGPLPILSHLEKEPQVMTIKAPTLLYHSPFLLHTEPKSHHCCFSHCGDAGPSKTLLNIKFRRLHMYCDRYQTIALLLKGGGQEVCAVWWGLLRIPTKQLYGSRLLLAGLGW